MSVACIFIISPLKFHLYLNRQRQWLWQIFGLLLGLCVGLLLQSFNATASGSGPTSAVDKAESVTIVNLKD